MIGDRWMVKGEMVKGVNGVRCMVKGEGEGEVDGEGGGEVQWSVVKGER